MTWQSRSPRRTRLPANWPTLRRHVLNRDGNRCQIHGPRCTTTATEVDHIQRGDDHHPTNLRAACTTCHRAKSSAEGNAARPRRHRPAEQHPGTTLGG